MPIIAVGAALFSSAIAATSVAATVGGIAAISLTTGLEIVAAVGATIGAIGAITKDKNLTMAGAIVGGIGGLGALAASAGVFAGTASEAGSITTSAADSAAKAVGDAATGANTLASGAPGSITEGGMAVGDAAAGNISAVNAMASGTTVPDLASQGIVGSITNQYSPGEDGQWTEYATPSATNPMAASNADPMKPVGGAANTSSANASATQTVESATPPPVASGASNVAGKVADNAKVAASGEDKSTFDAILGFARQNPAVTLGVLQAGGSFITGAFSSLTPAQVTELNARAAANNQAVAVSAQQQANLAMPKAVASSTPVTGTPAALVPQGLINQPPNVNVTGVA